MGGVGYAAVQVAVRRMAGRVGKEKKMQKAMAEAMKEMLRPDPIAPIVENYAASREVVVDLCAGVVRYGTRPVRLR